MHLQESPQAMDVARGSSAGDAIPFGAALGLSFVLTVTSVITICGCFQPTERRRLQFVICGVSFISSEIFLVVVSSRAYGAYLGLLLLISGLSGILEVEWLWHLLTGIHPKTRKVCLWTLAPICVLMVIGCIGFSKQNQDLLSIWTVLLFATSEACYFVLCVRYVILWFTAAMTATTWLFFCLGVPCFLVLILTGALVGDGFTGSIPPGPLLSAWVFSTMSSICTIRFQILRPLGIYKLLQKSTSQTGSQRQLDVQLHSDPSRQASLPPLRSNSVSTLSGGIRPDLSSYPDLPNRLSNHTTAQKGLEQKELDKELGIRSWDNILRQDSITALVAPSVVYVRDSSREG